MKHLLPHLLILILSLFPFLSRGQRNVVREPVDTAYISRVEQMIDSLERVQKVKEAVQKYESHLLREESTLHYEEMLPLLRGSIQYLSNNTFNEREGRFRTYSHETADAILELSPLAVTYLLEIAGVKGRSKLPRLLTANAISVALTSGLSLGLKRISHERRPNQQDYNSFPSHHTALAFLGASILDREFGHVSPWISVGGYSAATATAMLRLQHNAHYVNDIFMGAGIGVLSAQLGYFFADKFYGTKGIRQPHADLQDFYRFARFWGKPTSLALFSGSNWTSKHIHQNAFQILAPDFTGNVTLRTASTYYAGVEYSHFFSPYWAAEARVQTAITQVKTDISGSSSLHSVNVMAQHLNQWEAIAALKYSVPFKLEQRISFRLMLGDCYTHDTTFDYDLSTFSASSSESLSAAIPLAASTSNSSFVRIPSSHKFLIGGGLGVDVMSTRRYVAGIQIDYSHVFSPILPNRLSISTLWRILL